MTSTGSGDDSVAPAAEPTRAHPRKAATIYDIAQLAGVDPSTVSRALSKPGRINAITAQKIQEAARSLNYRVNPAARALPTGRTRTIGLIVSDITNPVFFDIVRGAEQEAANQNYTLVLAESRESNDTELLTAHRLLPSVDGLILATSRLDSEQIQELADEKPVVVLNRVVEGVESVVADVDAGVGQAVEHLAGLGHRRVGYLPGPERSWVSGRRGEAIAQQCAQRDIEVTILPAARPMMEGGRQSVGDVLAAGVTALFTYNDLQAIGLLLELTATGTRVPDGLSIIGFDDIFGADFTTPPLTTVGAPHAETAASAARSILARLDGAEQPVTDAHLRTELVVRGSTGPA